MFRRWSPVASYIEKGRSPWKGKTDVTATANPDTKLQQQTEIFPHHISLPTLPTSSLFLTHNLFHRLHLLFLAITKHLYVNNDMTGASYNWIYWQKNQCKDIAHSFSYMLSGSQPHRFDIFCGSDSKELSGIFWEIWPVQFYLELSVLKTDKIESKPLELILWEEQRLWFSLYYGSTVVVQLNLESFGSQNIIWVQFL